LFYISIEIKKYSINFRSVIFDLLVGSLDFGLLAAVASALINSLTLMSVRAFVVHLKQAAKDMRRQSSSCIMLTSQNFWTTGQNVSFEQRVKNKDDVDSQDGRLINHNNGNAVQETIV
jgi:hypothetical protein